MQQSEKPNINNYPPCFSLNSDLKTNTEGKSQTIWFGTATAFLTP